MSGPWWTAPSLAALVLAVVPVALVAISRWAGRQRPAGDKLASYECGFEPVGDARVRFDVVYYVVGILFLLFDLEIVLLLPYALAAAALPSAGALVPVLFLFTLLTLGFVYEWTRGALKVLCPWSAPQLPQGPREPEGAGPQGAVRRRGDWEPLDPLG